MLGQTGLVLRLGGDWTRPELPRFTSAELLEPTPQSIRLEGEAIADWDSRLLVRIRRLQKDARQLGITLDCGGLPAGAQRLLRLAGEPAAPPVQQQKPPGLLGQIGTRTLAVWRDFTQSVTFLGELFLALVRLLTGRARFLWSDLLLYIQEAGVSALPIVSLISLLVGSILAFVGLVQLRLFGAEIFIADAVAFGMAREMGVMMTSIIMAGRTGSAYAAQLGTMQVNEEIDAFRTLGVPVVEFLVMPRVVAMVLMMPLLTFYSVLVGMVGGFLVGVLIMDLTPLQYVEQTRAAFRLQDLVAGLIKSAVFAFIIASAGCLRGIQAGRSSASVGTATTSAMVTSIVLVVLADAVITLIYNRLDF